MVGGARYTRVYISTRSHLTCTIVLTVLRTTRGGNEEEVVNIFDVTRRTRVRSTERTSIIYVRLTTLGLHRSMRDAMRGSSRGHTGYLGADQTVH